MFGFQLPKDFLIGTANSAFQSEGTADRDGKSPSIMDHYAKVNAGTEHITGRKYTRELPDRGCFFYDHYEEYIEDMAKTGQNTYRHNQMAEYLQASLHCMVAHFRAVRLYKSMNLGGKISMVNAILSVSPTQLNAQDLFACQLHMDHYVGWWTEAVLEGTFPQSLLREIPQIADNMPENYQKILDQWFVPMDFWGLNYYMTRQTHYDLSKTFHHKNVESFYSAPGQMFTPYPPGLFDVVQYISERYCNVEIYITENGCALPNQYDEEKDCDDPERISYLREHLRMCARLIRAGYTNLKGYYYWNDADSYEHSIGYKLRFGLTWVDHKTGKRTRKKSRYYFSQICKTHMVD